MINIIYLYFLFMIYIFCFIYLWFINHAFHWQVIRYNRTAFYSMNVNHRRFIIFIVDLSMLHDRQTRN